MRNKFVLVIMFILASVVLVGCSVSNQSANKPDHPSLPFKQISLQQLTQKINNKSSMVVYIKRSSCTDCMFFEKQLANRFGTLQNIQSTYYVDLQNYRDTHNDREWNTLKNRIGFTQTPAFIAIKSGKRSSLIEWTSKGLPYKNLLSWYNNLSIQ